jgi:hypothetical protein
MSSRVLNRAAILYSLATMAHLDGTNPRGDEVERMRHRARKRAEDQLNRMGVSMNEVLDERDAIVIAKRQLSEQ